MSEGVNYPTGMAAEKNVIESDEWKRYTTEPCALTLISLSKATKTQPLTIFQPMAAEYARTGNWKIAQHLAILCNQWDRITLAFYFADKAMSASEDNILARLTYAEVLWKKRLPLSVLYHTPILWEEAEKLKDASQQTSVRSAAANLEICSRAYIDD